MSTALTERPMGRRTANGSVACYSTEEIRREAHRRNVNPLILMMDYVANELRCGTCQRSHQPGRTKVEIEDAPAMSCRCIEDGEPHPKCWRCDGTGTPIYTDRPCQSCHGELYERLPAPERLAAARYLAPYMAAQMKQVDHISSDGSRQSGMRVTFVEMRNGVAAPIDAPITGTSAARIQAPVDEHGCGD